jgi:hypothetical protein
MFAKDQDLNKVGGRVDYYLYVFINMAESTPTVVEAEATEAEVQEVDSIEAPTEVPTEVPSEIPTEEPPKKKRAPRKKKEPTILKTSDPNVEIEVKSRKPGPKKKRIVVYKDDLPPEPITIVEKTRRRGRPKRQPDVITEVEESQRLPTPPKKQPTLRELKKQELDLRFQELQQAAGRPLRQTKRGKVDKRCVSERTEAQIASARRLVELNKARAEERKKSDAQNAAKEVIATLSRTKSMRPKETPEPPRRLTLAELGLA